MIKVSKIVDTKKEKDATYEGTSILIPDLALEQTNIDDNIKQTSQTIGIVEQLGPLAFRFDDGSPKASYGQIQVGDKIHFQRYGSWRLDTPEINDCEYWLINDKDCLCAEQEE